MLSISAYQIQFNLENVCCEVRIFILELFRKFSKILDVLYFALLYDVFVFCLLQIRKANNNESSRLNFFLFWLEFA